MFRFRLIRFIMNIIRLALLARIKVTGLENLPRKGPYIVVLNHTSVIDTPVLLLAFPLVQWHFFAVEKWREHPVYGPIMTWLGAIFIKRNEIDRAQLRRAMDVLEGDIAFGLAPEGTRSKDGKMKDAKDGAAFLAYRTKAPIIPVGLVNNDRLFANFKKYKITQLEIRIGEPFHLPDVGRRAKSESLVAFTHLIMVRIAALLPQRYHGDYQDSPALAALQAGGDPWPHCQKIGQPD